MINSYYIIFHFLVVVKFLNREGAFGPRDMFFHISVSSPLSLSSPKVVHLFIGRTLLFLGDIQTFFEPSKVLRPTHKIPDSRVN